MDVRSNFHMVWRQIYIKYFLLLIFGAVGAFGGLLGAGGFDPKNFKDGD